MISSILIQLARPSKGYFSIYLMKYYGNMPIALLGLCKMTPEMKFQLKKTLRTRRTLRTMREIKEEIIDLKTSTLVSAHLVSIY